MLRKRRALMQKANVSHGQCQRGKAKIDELVRRYIAFVVQGRCIEVESSMVRRQGRWKEKVMKKQRRSD
jgi:hypothetical protein